MKVLTGTSGYSYKGWKGTFYPEDLPPAGMLRFYAERFPAVEINNTFYRMPSRDLLEGWAKQVPDSFSFALKATRRITHQKWLKDAGDPLSYLLETADTLGDKRGPLLFQLPPRFKKNLPRLQEFLSLLPANAQAAMEFRNPTWFEDDVYDTLRARGVALCASDMDEHQDVVLEATTGWGYLRLRRATYDRGQLESWARRIHEQPWVRAHVFFKHDEGGAPALASLFMQIAGATSTVPE